MKKINFEKGVVDLTHGSGGQAMARLIEQLFLDEFDNYELAQHGDGAVLPRPEGRIVMATDSHVISPLFFPGGDIGSLSVHGTVNDLSMMGATPLYLSCGFILEEGFPLKQLQQIVHSMAAAAREAGVKIVTGDTKVVEKGKGDGVFINTAGVGVLSEGVDLGPQRIQTGDKIIVNGTLGDHGIAILAQREGLQFQTTLQSDSASLNGLVASMLQNGSELHCLRDPTRGGVAATLNELAQQAGVGMVLNESALPLNTQVKAACELLGLEPLHIANEGKLIAICAAEQADQLLAQMRAHPRGEQAAIIGEVIEDERHQVQLETLFGSRRIVDWPVGEQLPRIC